MTATVWVFAHWIDAGLFALAILAVPLIGYSVRRYEEALEAEHAAALRESLRQTSKWVRELDDETFREFFADVRWLR